MRKRELSELEAIQMKTQQNAKNLKPAMTTRELAKLGDKKIAYIRAISSQEVVEKFPTVMGLEPGIIVWALFSAGGDPLVVGDDPNGVLSNAIEMNLYPVSLH